ncbi:protein of unknown function (plasmid) [Caballeronia sp. S22]
MLGGARAEYGQQVLAALARQLTAAYGRGWSEKQLRHCVRVAEVFPDEGILSALRRELSWTHLKTLMYIDDPLKRDYYIELCRLERWGRRANCMNASSRCSSSAVRFPESPPM